MKTLIIIPTYNERENIAALAEQITILNAEFHVLVVDDNSPDGTGSIVQSLGAKNCRIHLLSRPAKQGLGGAYLAGFAYAMQHNVEHIVTMDADFSHDPSRLESLVNSSLRYDVVIGSRYIAGGKIENWPWLRRQLSLTANRLARCAVGHDIGDWTSGYRCYRRHVIEKLSSDSLRSNGYSFLVEVLAACLQLGCRVTEVPITFCDRRSGRSKLSRVEIFKGMLTLLRLGLQRSLSAGICQR
jgi:glycosyltransferase involved in cell wall biosynthesis